MLHTSKYPSRRSGRPEMVREVLSRTRTEGNRMADEKRSKISRRSFLQKTAVGAAAPRAVAGGPAIPKKTGNGPAGTPSGGGKTPARAGVEEATHRAAGGLWGHAENLTRG